MAVHRTIVLDDGSNGFVTTSPKTDDEFTIVIEVTGTVWASIADVRKFAVELLDAYKDVAVVSED